MRIAIIRLSALGDIVNSVFVLSFIKEKYPNATIDWVCEEAFASLLERHPLVDNVHIVSIKRAKKERSLSLLMQTIRKLKTLGSYDHIIDLQGLLKSALAARVIGSNIHGFDSDSLREGVAARLYKTHTHIPYRENAMIRTAKIISDALDLDITADAMLSKPAAFEKDTLTPELRALFSPTEKNIVFTLGSSWPSKVYPKELFLEVAKLLEATIILVWGSEGEYQDAEFIAASCEECKVAPKLSLYELIQLITHADLLIGNDSGPTHMAWMQNRPSIALFGPTPAYKMMFETPINLAIESDSKIDPLKLNREDDSIKTILPETIVAKAEMLLR
ncbi:MAG: lipopolysaccharide heptosyltransferase I [Campylobacterota bacterium]|nr:lipopolysaccharide heptosyltransferase I [Campylobacterota bacterium]